MEPPRWLIVLGRLVFLGYVLFTAGYCLLAYIPFTYQQVHVGELLPWLTRLVRWHAVLFWPALAVGLVTILPELKSGPSRYLARGLAAAGLVAGVGLAIHPLLPQLTNDVSSLRWCLIALASLVWMAAIDWRSSYRRIVWKRAGSDADQALFIGLLGTAVYVAIIYLGLGAFRVGGFRASFSLSQWLSILVWVLASHLLVFLLLFVVLDFVALLSSLLPNDRWASRARFVGSIAVVAALVASVIRYVVLTPLSLNGAPASMVASVFGVCLVTFAMGTGVRLSAPDSGIEPGIDLLFVPLHFLAGGWAARSVVLIGLAGFAWLASARASRMDWEFLAQEIAVMIVAVLAFGILYPTGRRAEGFSRFAAYSIGAAILVLYIGLGAAELRTDP